MSCMALLWGQLHPGYTHAALIHVCMQSSANDMVNRVYAISLLAYCLYSATMQSLTAQINIIRMEYWVGRLRMWKMENEP